MKLDSALAARLTDEAIVAVGIADNKAWHAAALAAVCYVCFTRAEFTVDDVQLELSHEAVWTHEGRAMGAVMQEARKNGWMKSTGRLVSSAQPQCHKNKRTIWKSLLKSLESSDAF